MKGIFVLRPGNLLIIMNNLNTIVLWLIDPQHVQWCDSDEMRYYFTLTIYSFDLTPTYSGLQSHTQEAN